MKYLKYPPSPFQPKVPLHSLDFEPVHIYEDADGDGGCPYTILTMETTKIIFLEMKKLFFPAFSRLLHFQQNQILFLYLVLILNISDEIFPKAVYKYLLNMFEKQTIFTRLVSTKTLRIILSLTFGYQIPILKLSNFTRSNEQQLQLFSPFFSSKHFENIFWYFSSGLWKGKKWGDYQMCIPCQYDTCRKRGGE